MAIAEYYVKSDSTSKGFLGLLSAGLKNTFARSFKEIAKIVNIGDTIVLESGTYNLSEELVIRPKKQYIENNTALNNSKLVKAYHELGIDIPNNPVVIRGESSNAADTRIIGSIVADAGVNVVFENITFVNTANQAGIRGRANSKITFINCDLTTSKHKDPIVYGEAEDSQISFISSLIENDENKATVFSVGVQGFYGCNIQSALILRKNSKTFLSQSNFNCIHAFENAILVAGNCQIFGNDHSIGSNSMMKFYNNIFVLDKDRPVFFKCGGSSCISGSGNVFKETNLDPQILLLDNATAQFGADREVQLVRNGINPSVGETVPRSNKITVSNSAELFDAMQKALEGDTILINPGTYEWRSGLDEDSVQILNDLTIQGTSENCESVILKISNPITTDEGKKLIFKNLTLSKSESIEKEISLVGNINKDSYILLENCKVITNNAKRYTLFCEEGILDLVRLTAVDDNEHNMDIGAMGNGVVNISAESGMSHVSVQDNGTINISNSFLADATAQHDGVMNISDCTIYNYMYATDNSTINVDGGSIEANHRNSSGDISPLYLLKTAKINIEQAEIKNNGESLIIPILNRAKLKLDLVNYDSEHPITIDCSMSDDPKMQVDSPHKIVLLTKANLDAEESNALKENNEVEDSGSLKQQLIELKDLLDQGIITEEEFKAKKKQILGI